MSFTAIRVTPETIKDLLQELEDMERLGKHDDHADSAGYDDSYYGYSAEAADSSEDEITYDDGKEFAYSTVPNKIDLSPADGFSIYLDRLLTDILNGDVELDNTGEVAQLWEIIKNVEIYQSGRQNV